MKIKHEPSTLLSKYQIVIVRGSYASHHRQIKFGLDYYQPKNKFSQTMIVKGSHSVNTMDNV